MFDLFNAWWIRKRNWRGYCCIYQLFNEFNSSFKLFGWLIQVVDKLGRSNWLHSTFSFKNVLGSLLAERTGCFIMDKTLLLSELGIAGTLYLLHFLEPQAHTLFESNIKTLLSFSILITLKGGFRFLQREKMYRI